MEKYAPQWGNYCRYGKNIAAMANISSFYFSKFTSDDMPDVLL